LIFFSYIAAPVKSSAGHGIVIFYLKPSLISKQKPQSCPPFCSRNFKDKIDTGFHQKLHKGKEPEHQEHDATIAADSLAKFSLQHNQSFIPCLTT